MKEMQSTQQLAEGPRRASVNHDKALNECFQGILWVTVDGNSPGEFPFHCFETSGLRNETSKTGRIAKNCKQADARDAEHSAACKRPEYVMTRP